MIENCAKLFWKHFSRQATILRQIILSGELQPAFDAIEHLLQEYGYDFAFELTQEGKCAVLILTPEGDKEVASRIDALLSTKPPVSGWLFYGRRQQKAIEDAFTFVRYIYGIDISDCMFELLEGPEGFDINLISLAIKGLSDEESHGLVATLLDHLLGENVVMARLVNFGAESKVSAKGLPLLSARELVMILTKNENPPSGSCLNQ